MKNGYLDFDEYIRQGEPQQKERAEAWRVAIGLQAVDGLKTSEYLHETARRNIEGEISIDEARELIKTYYITKTHHAPDDDEKQEADQVSANITKILSYSSLDFSTKGYIALHRRIFEGVFKHAGQMRNYDITILNKNVTLYTKVYHQIILYLTSLVLYLEFGRYMHSAKVIPVQQQYLLFYICEILDLMSLTICLLNIHGISETP